MVGRESCYQLLLQGGRPGERPGNLGAAAARTKWTPSTPPWPPIAVTWTRAATSSSLRAEQRVPIGGVPTTARGPQARIGYVVAVHDQA
ncbi:hypothetical protein PV342_28830 [Streptomyces sp. PA03-3a]|nr:hypothetical protein [Streptomyces sp. PA03-3a]